MNNVSIKLRWVQGFSSGSAVYLSSDRIFIPCDSVLKSCRVDGQSQSSHPAPGVGIGCSATCPELGLVAIGERIQHPSIHVVRLPAMEVVSELKDGAREDYLALTFVGLEYLVSVGGPKDCAITTWKWSTAEKVYVLPHEWRESKALRVELSVNPSSWYQMCLQENFCLTFLQIKNSGGGHLAMTKKRLMLTRTSEDEVQILPLLDNVAAEDFDHLEMQKESKAKKMKLACHCWLPGNDVLVACADDSLVRFNTGCPYFSNACRADNNMKSVTSMSLNKSGLFVAKKDGFVEVLNWRSERWALMETVNIGESIKSIVFAPNYDSLAITTRKGSVYIYNASKDFTGSQKTELIFGGELSEIVSVCVLGADSRYCVTAKRNGLLQAWDMYDGGFVSNLHLDETLAHVSSSPLCSCVVAGAASGFVYFIDMTECSRPRIVHVIKQYDSPVEHICFDNFGRYIGMTAKSNSVQFFNGLPSSGFLELGHRDFPGETKDVKLFCMQDKSPTVVLVVVEDSEGDLLFKFALPLDLLREPHKYHADNLGTLTGDDFSAEQWRLTHQSRYLDAHSDLGAIFYSLTVQKIQRIPAWTESQNSPEPIYGTHNNAICFLRVSPDQHWLACIDIYGCFHMYIVGKEDVELAMEVADNCKNVRYSYFEFSTIQNTVVIAKVKGTIMCYEWTGEHETQKNVLESIAYCKIENINENICLGSMSSEVTKDGEQEITCRIKKNSSNILKELDEHFKECMDVFSYKLNNLLDECENLRNSCTVHFTLNKGDSVDLSKKNNEEIFSLIRLVSGGLEIEQSLKTNVSRKNQETVKKLTSLCLTISLKNYITIDDVLEALENIFPDHNLSERKGTEHQRENFDSETGVVSLKKIPNQEVLEPVLNIKIKMLHIKRAFNLKFHSLHYEKGLATRTISENYSCMKEASKLLSSRAEKDFWNAVIKGEELSHLASESSSSLVEDANFSNESGEETRKRISSLSENVTSMTKKFDLKIEKLYEEQRYCDFQLHKEEIRIFVILLSNSFHEFIARWKKNCKLSKKFLSDCQYNIRMLKSEVEQIEIVAKALYSEIQTMERENNSKADAMLKKLDEADSLRNFFHQEPIIELDHGCLVNPFWCHPSVITKRCLLLNSKISEIESHYKGKDIIVKEKLFQKKSNRDNFQLILRFLRTQALNLTQSRQRCEDLAKVLDTEMNRCVEIDRKMDNILPNLREIVQKLFSTHLQELTPEPGAHQTADDDNLESEHASQKAIRTSTFVNQLLQDRLGGLAKMLDNLQRTRREAESLRTNQKRNLSNMKHELRSDVKLINERLSGCKAVAEEFIEVRRKGVFKFFSRNVKETN